MKTPTVILTLALAGALGAGEIRPPFETELREAVNEYREGNFEEARAHTTRALEILDELKAGTVTSTLPDAPADWKAGEVRTEELPAVLGGGKILKRSYVKTGGLERIELEVIFDAPAIKPLLGLTASDEIAESQGYEVSRVGRDKGYLKPGNQGLELLMPIEETLLVKLVGSGGAGERELVRLAREIDRASLRKLD